MYSDVENSMHYTGRPQTPIEKASVQDELPTSEEAPVVEENDHIEPEATEVLADKSIEPNKPVE
jgi:hypothetical protein